MKNRMAKETEHTAGEVGDGSTKQLASQPGSTTSVRAGADDSGDNGWR